MKKVRILIMAVLLTFLISSVAFASRLDFTLVNETGYRIDVINVSPASSNSWEEDIMGKDYLANGESININFSSKENARIWDLQCVYTNGVNDFWYDIDLTHVSVITLRTENGVTYAYLDDGKSYSATKNRR